MTTQLEDAVELLDRSLAYTRVVLADLVDLVDLAALGEAPDGDGRCGPSAAPATVLARPTPCARWRLGDLLDHLADSLDAFTVAASGVVPLRTALLPVDAGEPGADRVTGRVTDRVSGRVTGRATGRVTGRVTGLQQQAGALLAAWSACAPEVVTVGGATLGGPLLGEAAALEIAVHGWDVSRATGRGAPVPDDLARQLLEVAHAVVTEADRGGRFAPARPARSPSYADRLLAFLGRS